MAQELPDQTLGIPDDPQIDATPSTAAGDSSPEFGDPSLSSPEFGDPSLSANSMSRRLNAGAAEFVPRAAPSLGHPSHHQRMVKVHRGPPPPPVVHHHAFHHPPPPGQHFAPSPPPGHGFYEYFEGGGSGEQEAGKVPADADSALLEKDGLSEEASYKITKQVEYYFSDVNLATTEHLMRFINKDPEGYVPIPVIASFKKIKALVHNYALLADALRKSSKLVVSEDGKKVRRRLPFTESDVEELQSRIVVAENLPEDHCYQNLIKIFSVVGSVKNIRTCYPQTPNGTAQATNRSNKMDMLFSNKVHAFVEYENVEDAEKAVTELNDGRNWRCGLRVRLLLRCMAKQGPRGKKIGQEGDGNTDDDDVSTTNLPHDKKFEDSAQSSEAFEHTGDEGLNDKETGTRLGRGHGRGVRGRGRGHNNNHRSGGHLVGTPPSGHQIHVEQSAITKQPPGPRMPDGTKGFTMGRGKPLISTDSG